MSRSLPEPMNRRRFCANSLAAAFTLPHCMQAQTAENVHFNVAEYDRTRILAGAAEALKQPPQTVTAIAAPGKMLDGNAYYSEDVEWFPVEGSPKSPFEHRPGFTNPSAFTGHRDALVRMNGIVAACVAAWRLTGEAPYAQHAMRHLQAWFVDTSTRMTPDLEHAATVPPAIDGNYRGVEETVTLAETLRAASFLCSYNGIATEEQTAALRKWFGDFGVWLNESKKGMIARETKDRTAICWTLQAAECARFARNGSLGLDCSHRFREKLLRQMDFDGEFPLELHRPNAYAASLFTLDCLSLTCEVLSTPLERLWDFTLPDGRGMRSAVAFLFPSIESRSRWRYLADARHFSDWPVRQPSLLLAGRAFGRTEYIDVWKRLPAEPKSVELLRMFPVRQPALWTVRPPA